MDLYGPPLPPGYVRPDDDDDDEEGEDSSESPTVDVCSPTSNPTKASTFIGPQIPEFLSRSKPDSISDDSVESSDISLDEKVKSSFLGPQLPLQNQIHDESSEDEAYGPMPIQSDLVVNDVNEARAAIEKRAKEMKNKLDNKHLPTVEVVQREEWMTVPDTSRKNQLGAISRCLAPEKASSSKEKRSHYSVEKDRKTTDELKKYNKSKRSESLLELHKKSKKIKEKKSKDKKSERKAFDRDEIAVHHFNKQQVNSVIDKAKFLNSRFSAGNNQYL